LGKEEEKEVSTSWSGEGKKKRGVQNEKLIENLWKEGRHQSGKEKDTNAAMGKKTVRGDKKENEKEDPDNVDGCVKCGREEDMQKLKRWGARNRKEKGVRPLPEWIKEGELFLQGKEKKRGRKKGKAPAKEDARGVSLRKKEKVGQRLSAIWGGS